MIDYFVFIYFASADLLTIMSSHFIPNSIPGIRKKGYAEINIEYYVCNVHYSSLSNGMGNAGIYDFNMGRSGSRG